MDEKLVEAVAQALWQHLGWRSTEWDDFADKDYLRCLATAAIVAIDTYLSEQGKAGLRPSCRGDDG